MNARVAYLVDETLNHPVLQSQSLTVIARLREAGVEVDLLVANGESAASEETLGRRFLGETGRIVFLSKQYRGRSPLAKALRAVARSRARRRAQRFLVASGERVIIHARGSAVYLGGRLRSEFKGSRLVADLRGDAAAEARFNHPGTIGERRATLVDRMDVAAFARADHVIGVSTQLVRNIRTRFALSCEATVIPCLADERTFFHDVGRQREMRKALAVSSSPLMVYAGSLGQWHKFESTLDTFEEVARRNPEVKFLIATREADRAESIIATRPNLQNRTLVRRGSASEVAGWMNAADIGVLLRDAHPLNQVACPTKFSEYALSGLSVVVSEGIGDLGRWVVDLGLGKCVVGADASAAASACIDLIERRGENDRVSRAQRARPTLSMGARVGDLLGVYRKAWESMRREGE